MDTDTIVAIATPPGRGGIGVLRLSGEDSARIATHLVQTKRAFAPNLARYGHIVDSAGERIDDALVTLFRAPHSYTGEDVVEISTHGSPVVLNWLLHAALQHGARLARAGEFTERAFLGGRMDLTEAEAVRDLIEAKTLTQAKLAAEQMGGSLSAQIRPVKLQLVALIATLEAGIDFAEDDLDTLSFAAIATRIKPIYEALSTLLSTFRYGRVLRDGLRLAIVGPPNAGKSSLFNRLLERERAIVTAIPGTTRDVIAEHISIGGIPVELLDTAGLRATDDAIEQIGIARSHEAIAEADLVLVVTDARTHHGPNAFHTALSSSAVFASLQKALTAKSLGARSLGAENLGAEKPDAEKLRAENLGAPGLASETWDFGSNLPTTLMDRPHLLIFNKSDLLSPEARRGLSANDAQDNAGAIQTSALTGEGMDNLRAAILAVIGGDRSAAAVAQNSATLTNVRHHDAVSRSVDALARGMYAAQKNTPHEMLLLDLYEALHALDELTGQTTGDDVLNLIFSTFCIGK